MTDLTFEPRRLTYEIDSCSGYTSDYHPSKIILDSPQDANSRWTGVPKSNAAHAASFPSAGPSSVAAPANGRRKVQYITLKLEAVSVLSAIRFGKHHKVHPCNLQDFTIRGGTSPDPRYMTVLLEQSLKNDSQPETFALAPNAGEWSIVQPVRYVRIEALSPHQTNYNVAIWHVALEGTNDPATLSSVVAAYEDRRARTTHHLLLSHLRRSALLPTFHALRAASPLSAGYEHSLVSLLHTTLVEKGDFSQSPDGVEAVLHRWLEAGLLREWAPGGGKGKHVARWTRVHSPLADCPSPRGGHQMVRCGRQLVLFAGYDGTRNFGDLWTYDLPTPDAGPDALGGPWKCVHGGYEGRKGEMGERPRERSCHQMVGLEGPDEGWVYMLGGLIGDDRHPDIESSSDDGEEDEIVAPIAIPAQNASQAMDIDNSRDAMGLIPPEMAPAQPITPPPLPPSPRSQAQRQAARRAKKRSSQKSDFWRYCAYGPRAGEWELISADTSAQGGPPRLWDHQMCVARGGKSLWVFGGRVERRDEEDDEDERRYGGLWEFDLERGRWTLHAMDPVRGDAFKSDQLLARLGHALVADESNETVYVVGGQRKDHFLSDIWTIDLRASTTPSGKVVPKLLSADTAVEGGPPGTFSQRVVISPSAGWIVLSGAAQLNDTKEVHSQEIYVRPRAEPGKAVGGWEKVVRAQGEEPVGRFAAQVEWDERRGETWLFGGNPADSSDKTRRLADLWRLKITRPTPEEALRKATFLVRKQRFAELCRSAPALLALEYLQTTLSAVVDHSDADEADQFRRCMSSLLNAPPVDDEMNGSASGGVEEYEGRYAERQALFELLVGRFVPRGEGPRGEDLRDLCAAMEQS